MSAQVAIYLRDKKVIVVPQGGGGGYGWDVEPILIVLPEPDEVSAAIPEALMISQKAQGGTPPKKQGPSTSPLLKSLGVRSFKAVYSGSSYCYLYEEGGELTLLRFRPSRDQRGFDLESSPPETLSDIQHAGSAVLKCLQSSPRMP
jgi:hypothetical protein